MSPIIYSLIVKALGWALDYERRVKRIPGIRIVRGDKRINHSQFVDDTLLISGVSIILTTRFKNIMDLFTEFSWVSLTTPKSNSKHGILAHELQLQSLGFLASYSRKIGSSSSIWGSLLASIPSPP
jgi:hypothetical protein